MSEPGGALSALLKRDGLIAAAALIALTALAWAYVLWLAAGMNAAPAAMPGMDMGAMLAPAFVQWTAMHALFVFTMWAVMMIGMMTPSVAPMVLIYTQVARQSGTLGKPFAPAGWFASGYLLAWTLFAALATAAQFSLEQAALLSPAMASTSRYFGGAILLVAGLYQLSPLKNACLSQCRAPLSFVQRHGGFQSTAFGSLRLGALHGFYCIGCCWALMALLFVGGVMNVLWIAAIMIFVLAEKIVPGGRYLSTLAGIAALAAGAWMIGVQN
ncbi:MAG: DUF2182 domain-containing protein [Proteobacteria bacterium]|nr:DUF2182 domain-containing protein [Pseudomonadota bacterium]